MWCVCQEAEKDIRDYNDMQLRDKVLTFYKEKRHLQKQRRQVRYGQAIHDRELEKLATRRRPRAVLCCAVCADSSPAGLV